LKFRKRKESITYFDLETTVEKIMMEVEFTYPLSPGGVDHVGSLTGGFVDSQRLPSSREEKKKMQLMCKEVRCDMYLHPNIFSTLNLGIK
jgi:hypothetical protein